MKQELKIINYIDINGEDVPIETLPEEKRKKIAEMIQDRMMATVGFRRKHA